MRSGQRELTKNGVTRQDWAGTMTVSASVGSDAVQTQTGQSTD